MNSNIKNIYSSLNPEFRKEMKEYIYKILSFLYSVRSIYNFIFLKEYLVRKYRKLHLGCGDIRIKNCLNLDYRATRATDIVHDCTKLSIFKGKSFSAVYSHAFFEHLYRFDRVGFLLEIKRILNDKGIVIFLAIPDFERIARAYLNKEEGIVSPKFDLFNVYRYTHGDPEQYPKWWQEQLHKSLFDKYEVKNLLEEAGFKSFVIFRYCFGSEKLPLNLGFIAFREIPHNKIGKEFIKKTVTEFTDKINLGSIKLCFNSHK